MKQKAHFHRVVWTLGRKLWAVFEVSPAPVSSSHSLRVNYRLRAALRGAITGKHTVLILDCRTAMWLMISCFESRQQRRMWGSLCRVPFTSLGWAFFGPERERNVPNVCVCMRCCFVCVCAFIVFSEATPHINSFEGLWHNTIKAGQHSSVTVLAAFHMKFEALCYLKIG